MPVLIEKDQDITLANPVLFRIIPLTAQQALDQGFITPADLPAENPIAPNRAGLNVYIVYNYRPANLKRMKILRWELKNLEKQQKNL